MPRSMSDVESAKNNEGHELTDVNLFHGSNQHRGDDDGTAETFSRQDTKKRKVAFASMFGNVLEWYDFGVFAFFAPEIGLNFFPKNDKVTGIMNSFAVFGVAFLVRPLGGMMFGHIGDRYGRKTALQISVALMGASTFSIGCLPTYATAGLLAPLGLTICRLLQGMSVGGEFVGSIIYSVESAPPGRKVFFGSLCEMGVFVGLMLGSCTGFVMHKIVSEDDLVSFGWRIPFLLGLLIGAFALWMRGSLEESAEFVERKKQNANTTTTTNRSSPVIDGIRQQPITILLSFLALAAQSFAVWFILVFPPVLYLELTDPPLGSTRRAGDGAATNNNAIWFLNTLVLFMCVVLTPVFGTLGNRLDVRSSMAWASLALAILALPCSTAMGSGHLGAAILGQTGLALVCTWLGATLPAYVVQCFPVHVRYSCLAVGWNGAMGLFGGTAGLIATYLFQRFQTTSAIGFYMLFLSCVSGSAVLLNNARARRRETSESMIGPRALEEEEEEEEEEEAEDREGNY